MRKKLEQGDLVVHLYYTSVGLVLGPQNGQTFPVLWFIGQDIENNFFKSLLCINEICKVCLGDLYLPLCQTCQFKFHDD
jgi:hypothetical protein